MLDRFEPENFLLWLSRLGMALPVILYVLTISGFWLDIAITSYHLYVGILVCGLLMVFWCRMENSDGCVPTVVISTVLVIVYMFAVVYMQSHVHDDSYDGQQYHAEAIYQLANGFNPVREMIVPNTWEVSYRGVWLNTLSNYSWIIGGLVYKLTGEINTAKLLPLYYMPFVALYIYVLAARHTGRGWAAFLGLAASMNPVVLTQVFTNYIDSIAYLTLAAAFLALIDALSNRGLYTFIWAVLLSAAALTVKLTSVIPLVVIWLILLFSSPYIRSRLLNFKAVSFVLVLGILIFYLPYVTNLQRYGNLLYPLHDEVTLGEKADYEENFVPSGLFDWLYEINYPPYQEVARPLAFLMSQFSVTHNSLEPSPLRMPFVFTWSEFELFKVYDIRVNGFGPLFSGVLVLAAALLFFLDYKNRTVRNMVFIAMLLTLTAAFTPQGWWARYVGYFWLVPILVLLASCIEKHRLYRLNYLAAFVIGANIAGILIVQLTATYQSHAYYNRNYIPMLESKNREGDPWMTACDFFATQVRFHERGVKYVCTRTSSAILELLLKDEDTEARELVSRAYEEQVHRAKGSFKDQHELADRFFGKVFMLDQEGLAGEEIDKLAELFGKPLIYDKKKLW